MDSTTSPDTAVADDGRLARGRARIRELAVENEAERKAEQAALLADVGREPSHAERVIVEQLSTLIVRGRRLRQAGRGADAEMVARLVMRGMTKFGIRQGAAKPAASPTDVVREYFASFAQPATAATTAEPLPHAPSDGGRISEAPDGRSGDVSSPHSGAT